MKKNVLLTLALIASFLVSALQLSPTAAAPLSVKRQPPQTAASLNEVLQYYGRLGDMKGPIGVVVEFSENPAALQYAKAQEQGKSPQAQASATRSQLDTIRRQQDAFAGALGGAGIQAQELFRTQRAYNGIWMYVDASQLEQLAKLPGIKALHPIIPKTLDNTTSVPLIGALQAWAGSGNYQGQNIKVGIIDTGIDYVHTNFGGGGVYTGQDFTTLSEIGNLFPTAKVVGGWDFAGDAYDANGTGAALIPNPDPDPMDCNGHGSHVAGTTAGFGVLPDGSTYVESGGDTYAALAGLPANDYIDKFRIGPGVAPKAELYALRVFGCAGSTSLTEQAIEWAMDPNDDGDFSDHLDVINMSLGSSFGSEYDTSAIASNNAAEAGVIVVASSGNSGDVYYITGAPAVARRAISVASSMDSGATYGAFELTATSGSMSLGTYIALPAAFGPATFNLTGDLVYSDVPLACTVPTNVSGKIALVDRGTCGFSVKYDNVIAAGAIGMLVANNAAGVPIVMGGTPVGPATAPAMMTSQAVGTALKADLTAGTVTVRLSTDYASVVLTPANENNLSTFTSRGIARVGNYLKPDIAAPGETVFSTAVGTGSGGESMSGTSMAAPHVSGAMALLREQHPTWTVAELKALVMNTATQDISQTGGASTPSNVGAGRIKIEKAIDSEVIAYSASDPELVSVAFGSVQVIGTQTLVKDILIKNKGGSAETYNVAFVSRYNPNAGIAFSLVDAANNPVSSVTVGAGGFAAVTVKVELEAASLEKTLDPRVALGTRQRMAESGGFVQFTSTGAKPTLRVPVHIAARAASNMRVTETSLNLPVDSGTVSLTPTGAPVDLGSDFSLVYILELLGESPAIPALSGKPEASVDLRYIGAMSDYPDEPWGGAAVYFGFSTAAPWDTFQSTEFDIYVDVDEDNVDDYVIYNYNLGQAGGGAADDTLITVVVNLHTNTGVIDSFVNAASGGLNTNVFNNNAVVMPVSFDSLGLDETTNTGFNFFVVTFQRDAPGLVDISDVYHYDVAKKAFTFTYLFTDDNSAYSPTFDVDYNKANMTADTQGLLLLHTHNRPAKTAEVVPLAGHVVAFNANGGSGTMVAQIANTSTALTLNAFTRTGYAFSGWNTKANGTGIAYADGATYDFLSSMTLYAQWTALYTVTYDGNGNDSGAAPVDPSSPYTSGSTVTVLGNSGSLAKTGYLFMGWNTQADGLGTSYAESDTFVIAANTTLYAKWSAEQTATLFSKATQDGWILESGENTNKGGTKNAAASTLRLGDDEINRQYRSILSFVTGPSLPDTAVITKVTLKVKKQGIVGGGNPVTMFQGFSANIRNGYFDTDPALQLTDFLAAANYAVGPLTISPIGGWYSFDLTSAKAFVNKLAANDGLTQIRLRFVLDDNNNNIANYLVLYSGNASAANRPQLIIEYYVP